MLRRTISVLLLATLFVAGCAFNRADFVAGPNGEADQSQMSDTGRTMGPFIRGLLGGSVTASVSH